MTSILKSSNKLYNSADYNIGYSKSYLQAVNNKNKLNFPNKRIDIEKADSVANSKLNSKESLPKSSISLVLKGTKSVEPAPKEEEKKAPVLLGDGPLSDKQIEALNSKSNSNKAKSQRANILKSYMTSSKPIEPKAIKIDELAQIRFSQESCCEETFDGISLDDLVSDMLKNGFKKEYSIHVVLMPDNTLTSMDNRRLEAAKRVAQFYKNDISEGFTTTKEFKVYAYVHHHSYLFSRKDWFEKIQGKFLSLLEDVDQNEQEAWLENPAQIKTGQNWGYAIVLRMKSDFNSTYSVDSPNRYGFTAIQVLPKK